jgi:hypothetical protein
VVGRDGRPAAGATVLALVFATGDEPSSRVPHVFHADAAGTVLLDVPLTDPVIAGAPATQRLFNVVAMVLDVVGERVQYQAIPYVLNLGDPGWPADPTGIDGQVFGLRGDAPVMPPGDLVTARSAGAADDAAADPYGCHWAGYPYVQPPPAWTCTIPEYPESLRAVPVPVAENVSAGADFRVTFRYETSQSTITSTLVGIDGVFLEATRSATVEETTSQYGTKSRAGVRFGQLDGRVRDATVFQVMHITTCVATVGCAVKADVVSPYRMDNTFSSEVIHSYHDRMVGADSRDCGNYMDAGTTWTNSNGTINNMAFTVGFDVSAQYKAFTLHATSTVTTENERTESESLRWSVPETGNEYPHHYVYVPRGLALYDASNPNAAACPATAPGLVFTDASNNPAKSPDAPGFVPPVTPVATPPEVKPVPQTARRCVAAPDRCGRE